MTISQIDSPAKTTPPRLPLAMTLRKAIPMRAPCRARAPRDAAAALPVAQPAGRTTRADPGAEGGEQQDRIGEGQLLQHDRALTERISHEARNGLRDRQQEYPQAQARERIRADPGGDEDRGNADDHANGDEGGAIHDYASASSSQRLPYERLHRSQGVIEAPVRVDWVERHAGEIELRALRVAATQVLRRLRPAGLGSRQVSLDRHLERDVQGEDQIGQRDGAVEPFLHPREPAVEWTGVLEQEVQGRPLR